LYFGEIGALVFIFELPHSLTAKYMARLNAPNFEPNAPDSITKKVCSVIGTCDSGILMNAPGRSQRGKEAG